jgi:hypothetical protein
MAKVAGHVGTEAGQPAHDPDDEVLAAETLANEAAIDESAGDAPVYLRTPMLVEQQSYGSVGG